MLASSDLGFVRGLEQTRSIVRPSSPSSGASAPLISLGVRGIHGAVLLVDSLVGPLERFLCGFGN